MPTNPKMPIQTLARKENRSSAGVLWSEVRVGNRKGCRYIGKANENIKSNSAVAFHVAYNSNKTTTPNERIQTTPYCKNHRSVACTVGCVAASANHRWEGGGVDVHRDHVVKSRVNMTMKLMPMVDMVVIKSW